MHDYTNSIEMVLETCKQEMKILCMKILCTEGFLSAIILLYPVTRGEENTTLTIDTKIQIFKPIYQPNLIWLHSNILASSIRTKPILSELHSRKEQDKAGFRQHCFHIRPFQMIVLCKMTYDDNSKKRTARTTIITITIASRTSIYIYLAQPTIKVIYNKQ